MPLLEKTYIDTGKVRYIARMWYNEADPNSRMGAEAAYCAGEQDKFWEMHRWLFEHVDEWAYVDDLPATLAVSTSADLGLDGAALESCLRQGKYSEQVEAFYADSRQRGIPGTPTFLIIGRHNQTPLVGAYPFENFQEIIEQELAP